MITRYFRELLNLPPLKSIKKCKSTTILSRCQYKKKTLLFRRKWKPGKVARRTAFEVQLVCRAA